MWKVEGKVAWMFFSSRNGESHIAGAVGGAEDA